MVGILEQSTEITIKIQKLPEDGLYLATSDELDGLFVQADNEADIYDLSRSLAQDLIAMDDNIENQGSLNINYKMCEA